MAGDEKEGVLTMQKFCMFHLKLSLCF